MHICAADKVDADSETILATLAEKELGLVTVIDCTRRQSPISVYGMKASDVNAKVDALIQLEKFIIETKAVYSSSSHAGRFVSYCRQRFFNITGTLRQEGFLTAKGETFAFLRGLPSPYLQVLLAVKPDLAKCGSAGAAAMDNVSDSTASKYPEARELLDALVALDAACLVSNGIVVSDLSSADFATSSPKKRQSVEIPVIEVTTSSGRILPSVEAEEKQSLRILKKAQHALVKYVASLTEGAEKRCRAYTIFRTELKKANKAPRNTAKINRIYDRFAKYVKALERSRDKHRVNVTRNPINMKMETQFKTFQRDVRRRFDYIQLHGDEIAMDVDMEPVKASTSKRTLEPSMDHLQPPVNVFKHQRITTEHQGAENRPKIDRTPNSLESFRK